MAIHEKPIGAEHLWGPAAAKPQAAVAPVEKKPEAAPEASVAAHEATAGALAANHSALFGHWAEDKVGQVGMEPPPPGSTQVKGHAKGKHTDDLAKKVATDPGEHVKNDPGLAQHVVAAQNVLQGGGGGDKESGVLHQLAASTSALTLSIPFLTDAKVGLIPFILRLVDELARRIEEERRRILTPDDAAKHGKNDPTYAQRLTLAQDLIKIGGHGKLEEGKYVVEELVKMPIEALQQLKDKKTKVVVCKDSVTDYLTDLKGVRPRGWPPGSTWDTVPGLNSSDKNEVVIAIRGRDTPAGPHVPKTGDGHGASNLVLHEGMHGVDLNARQPGDKALSETSEFTKARDADGAVQNNGYLAQPGAAGRQETFAEVAARFYSGDPNLKKEMPKIYAYFAANPFAAKPQHHSPSHPKGD